MSILTSADTVKDLRAALKDITAAISIAIVLLSGSQWLYEMVVTISIHLSKEISTSCLQLLPELRFAAAIPCTSVSLNGVLALIVRLCIVEKR